MRISTSMVAIATLLSPLHPAFAQESRPSPALSQQPASAQLREVGGCTPPAVWSTLQKTCVVPLRTQHMLESATAKSAPASTSAQPIVAHSDADAKKPKRAKPAPASSSINPIVAHYDGDANKSTPVQPAPTAAQPQLPRNPSLNDDPLPPHPKDPLPPAPRPQPTPIGLPQHHMPRDPGMGNGEAGPGNPGGNPIEPALPCPPGFYPATLRDGQSTCVKAAAGGQMPPAPTARSQNPGGGRPVPINRPQSPNPIEDRLGHPNAAGTEPGGIMGPAGSPVPSGAAQIKCPPGSKLVPVNPPHPYPKRCMVPTE